MGNSLKKISPGGGTEEGKTNELESMINQSYDELKTVMEKTQDEPKQKAEFYRAICEIVEEMNQRQSNTQFRVPKRDVLLKAFKENYPRVDSPKHVGIYYRADEQSQNHEVQRKSLTKEEFGKILQQVITETGFSGVGAKDSLIYIFGVPITALLLK